MRGNPDSHLQDNTKKAHAGTRMGLSQISPEAMVHPAQNTLKSDCQTDGAVDEVVLARVQIIGCIVNPH